MGILLAVGATVFAEEWFDAYEKGLDALSRREGSRAAELLERAVRKRSGPGENLLTYGTNRIQTYHPYLRLTEAYLMAGNPEAASRALRISLQKGKEPADEQARLVAVVDAALRQASATAPPETVAAAPTAVPAPTVAPSTQPIPVDTQLPVAAAPSPLLGTLSVISVPAGATVFLDGALIGETPLRLDKPSGEYRVKLRRDGFAELAFTTRITPGKTAQETRSLVAVAPASALPSATPAAVGSLMVFSDPPGASIYIDDELAGVTDSLSGRLVKSGIRPGNHVVRGMRSDRQDQTQSVRVDASGSTTLRLALAPHARGRLPQIQLAGLAALAVVLIAVVVVRMVRKRRIEEPPTVALASAEVGTPTPGRAATPRSTHRLPSTPRPTHGKRSRRETPPAAAIETSGTAALDETAERFGDFVLRDQLGRGGMATVFLAERHGELFALKRPLASFLDEPEFLQRFLREAEIGRTLHHPNIIRIFERGEVDCVPYFTMEVVNGRTLQEVLRAEQSLDPRSAADIVAQVAEALDYAHLKGVVHRDLKPSNIMVLDDATVKVMDYGIARVRRFEGLTLTGSFLGTPDYIAPETAEGKGADARSDLYSLGVVFYEILTGRKPFQGDTPFAILRKHCTEPPTPPSRIVPDLPPELETIVLKLLEKSPDRRYLQAEDLLIDLRAFLNRAA